MHAVALSAQDSQWINQLRHDVYSGDDYAEGIAAFREKRPPDFASRVVAYSSLFVRETFMPSEPMMRRVL